KWRGWGGRAGLGEGRGLGAGDIRRAGGRLYLRLGGSHFLLGRTDFIPPSRFLSEIPAELVDVLGEGEALNRSARGGKNAHRDAVVSAALTADVGRGPRLTGLRVGDDVGHDTFGEGVVLDLIGEGEKAEAVVRFRDVGEKRLL